MPFAAVLRILIVALVLAVAGTARADYVSGLNPAGDNYLALRSGPGTTYRMLRRMGPGTVVTVLERRGDWLRVELEDGTEGWAFRQYIAPGFPPGYGEDEAEEGGLELVPVGPDDEGPTTAVEAEEQDATEETAEEEALPTDEVAQQWTTYANDRFGTTIAYPAGLFRVLPPTANDEGRSFAARQGEGGFTVSASENALGMTLDELMADDEAGGGYDSVAFRRKGEDWYVLAGQRGGLAFYRKVLLGDGGNVVHAFEITYPRAQKPLFDAVAARMGQSLGPSEGAVADQEDGDRGRPPAGDEVAGQPVLEVGDGETPLATGRVLFDGTLGDDWVAHSAGGGDFERHATLEGGALVVDVPAENGWGQVGILSPNGLVWLDDFGPEAETKVTFAFDPERTTGFAVSLAVPGYGGVRGNEPGRPDVTMTWTRASDGRSAKAQFFVDLTMRSPFKTLELPADAPGTVTVILRPYEVAWTLDDGEEIVAAFASARPGIGLHVYAYSLPAEWNLPAKMALRSITLDQARDPAVSAMQTVEQGVLFDGDGGAGWEPIFVEGGDLDKYGAYRNGYLVVDVPENSGWAQTGLVSAEPKLSIGPFSDTAPYLVRLRFDPRRTTGFAVGLGPDAVYDWWSYHWAYVTIVTDPDGRRVLTAADSPYTSWERPLPESWAGELVLTLSAEGTLASIPEGPSIFVPRPVAEGAALHFGLTNRPYAAGRPSRFALDSVTWERVVRADLPEDEMWFFRPPEQFGPEAFLDDLRADLLEELFAPDAVEGAMP